MVLYAAADLLITGLMQWCLTNYLLGINTCRENAAK
ncbi:YgaP-like transmembrane domain [Halogeometricum salsisoli]